LRGVRRPRGRYPEDRAAPPDHRDGRRREAQPADRGGDPLSEEVPRVVRSGFRPPHGSDGGERVPVGERPRADGGGCGPPAPAHGRHPGFGQRLLARRFRLIHIDDGHTISLASFITPARGVPSTRCSPWPSGPLRKGTTYEPCLLSSSVSWIAGSASLRCVTSRADA